MQTTAMSARQLKPHFQLFWLIRHFQCVGVHSFVYYVANVTVELHTPVCNTHIKPGRRFNHPKTREDFFFVEP